MIIHSYFTDGLFEWAELFLSSLKKQHGETHPVVLSSRDISNDQIDRLKRIYANLEIRNAQIDYESLSDKTGVSVAELHEMKNGTEHGKFSVLWKQFISVEDRYGTSIVDVMRDHVGGPHSHMLHIDIDMYFRDRLDELFEIIEANDISIHFRSEDEEKARNENRKVLGSLIGFRLDARTLEFMDVWKRHIDSIPLSEKPLGFGQTSFYRAYLDTKDRFRWGQVPIKFSDPSRDPDAPVWAGNRGTKDSNLRLSWIDFRHGIPVPPNPHPNPRRGIQKRLAEIISSVSGGSFLEIGLGPRVRLDRYQLIKDCDIDYVGLDFDHVCKMHADGIAEAGIAAPKINFVPNDRGTYLYNLVRLQREGRTFDLVFLDGHHTLYTDMAATFAIIPLLKPGSIFVLDDVEFTLKNKEQDLTNSEFYHSLYDFSQYHEDERAEAHIGVILYEYLLPMFNFELDPNFSSSAWVALRVPKSGIRYRKTAAA